VASAVSVTNSLAASSILNFGTDEQKQRWLPGIASGATLCSALLTEPGGGTDLGNMASTATKVDGGYRLTGTKVFISHAAYAGLFFCVASMDLSKKHKGVTAFLIDPHNTEGITMSDFPMRTLKRDNLAEVHMENAFVPDEALLGKEGGGFPVLGPHSTRDGLALPRAVSVKRNDASTSRSPMQWNAKPLANPSASFK
jgi:alkylation response protein AidB-like acyl-CoA dehydrogenase